MLMMFGCTDPDNRRLALNDKESSAKNIGLVALFHYGFLRN